MGSSDEALLAGLTAGDRDASAAFVRRFRGRAYGLARTIVGDPGTAEDVAQEAFVRAWRYGASYDARRGTVVTWLLRIVRNVAVDRLRLRLAEPLDPELLASKLQLHDSRAARDDQAVVVEREQLRRALATLPAEQRRALLSLQGFDGRSEARTQGACVSGAIRARLRTPRRGEQRGPAASRHFVKPS